MDSDHDNTDSDDSSVNESSDTEVSANSSVTESSDADASDSSVSRDAESDDESDEMDIDLESEEEQNEANQPLFDFNPAAGGLNQNVAQREGWRPLDYFYTILSRSLRDRSTYESILGQMEIVNAGYVEQALPKSKTKLWKLLGRNRCNMTYRVYCSSCETFLGIGKRPTEDCDCGLCGPAKKRQPLAIFVQLNIASQLKQLFRRPGITAALAYRDTRQKRNEDAIEDIYDGAMYRALERNFLCNRDNYSLTLWLDGVKVAKSSAVTTIPVLFQLNELPPHARKKYILLGGVWVGAGKPTTNLILEPIVDELTDLYNTGITWTPVEGGMERTSRIVTPILSCDSDARYAILGMTRFNGEYGCTFCLVPGEPVQNRRYYPANMRAPLRDHATIVRDMRHVNNTGDIRFGVRNVSALMLLPDFNLSFGQVVESFHNSFEGVAKKLTELITSNPRHLWYVKNPDNKRIINNRLAEIKTPTRISRRPRPIDDLRLWKGTEWRNWVIYYAPVVLSGILPPDGHLLFTKLSEVSFRLNKSSIMPDDLNRAAVLIDEFIYGFEEAFGNDSMVYNLHLLRHTVASVRNWGPHWVHSGAIFEGWNRKVHDTVTSANDRPTQIVDRFLMRQYLQEAMHNEALSPEARELMRKHLEGGQWEVPPLVSTGLYFHGLKEIGNVNFVAADIAMIQNRGYQVDLRTEVTLYEGAVIHGATYKVFDGENRACCDHLVHATCGFYICRQIIAFTAVDGQTVQGIVGTELLTQDPVLGTSYIRPYTPSLQRSFIPHFNVISPAISINWNTKVVLIPLPNVWETD